MKIKGYLSPEQLLHYMNGGTVKLKPSKTFESDFEVEVTEDNQSVSITHFRGEFSIKKHL